jgi:hypothetical protein
MRTSFVKWLVIAGVIGAVGLAGASGALATTATGSQNPDLTVSVSLASSETVNPDVATVGDEVDVVLSVRNNQNGGGLEPVKIRLALTVPSGEPYSLSYTIYLWPGQTLRLPFDYTVSQYFPKGVYSLTIEATEVKDPTKPASSATATIEIV